MPRFPSPIKNVDRGRVGAVVQTMLRNADVGDVDCEEQTDHRYTVRPRRRIQAPPAALTRKKTTKKKTTKKKSTGRRRKAG